MWKWKYSSTYFLISVLGGDEEPTVRVGERVAGKL